MTVPGQAGEVWISLTRSEVGVLRAVLEVGEQIVQDGLVESGIPAAAVGALLERLRPFLEGAA